jgi:ankyrin repeat protein
MTVNNVMEPLTLPPPAISLVRVEEKKPARPAIKLDSLMTNRVTATAIRHVHFKEDINLLPAIKLGTRMTLASTAAAILQNTSSTASIAAAILQNTSSTKAPSDLDTACLNNDPNKVLSLLNEQNVDLSVHFEGDIDLLPAIKLDTRMTTASTATAILQNTSAARALSTLEIACQENDPKKVFGLLNEKNVDLSCTVGKECVPLLHFAVAKGWTKVVHKLIALKVDVNVVYDGKIPLITAFEADEINEDILIALLEGGADYGCYYKFELPYRTRFSRKVEAYLKERRVYFSEEKLRTATALTWACMFLPATKKTALWLIDHKAPFDCAHNAGIPAFHWVFGGCWSQDFARVAEEFLKKGEDINVGSAEEARYSWTVLEWASERLEIACEDKRSSEEICAYCIELLWLLDHGARPHGIFDQDTNRNQIRQHATKMLEEYKPQLLMTPNDEQKSQTHT